MVVKITKDDQEIIKTIKLISFIEDYDQDLEVLEYILYIVQKKKEQGGCDTREHFQCINSGEYFLNIKSLKSSDNNCGISIFTNSLKIKLQPNTLRKNCNIPLYEKLTFEHMEKLAAFFHNDICIYKKIEDGFKIVFETNMFSDKKQIETLLFDERNNNDDHYWLILSHNVKKNHGTCDECGEENINISEHKCSYDFIIKKRYESINKNETITWDKQYENVDNAIKNGKNIIITGGGGVGKSYMIKKLNEKYKIINTASTGTAAININGVTIHNLLRLFQDEKMLLKYNRDLNKYYLSNIKLRTCEFICIDEISMIDGATFDNIINRIKFVDKYRKKILN